MSFASDPGRDDGGLPPVNIVIPDDARELDRDVLAYRRELRARRRRELLMRVLFLRHGDGLARRSPGRHSVFLPLAAACVALLMLAGAMLSVVTISPASAPTVAEPAQAPTSTAGLPVGLTLLPTGSVNLDGQTEPIRGMASAALALVPPDCGCGPALRRLAAQAATAHVPAYFVGEGAAIPQMATLTAQYGAGTAVAASDSGGVLDAAYRPEGLTVLLVYSDATAQVRRDLSPDFQFGPALRALSLPGREAAS